MEVHKNGVVNSKDLNLVIEVLKKYLKSEEFKLKSFDINPASEEHTGFLGEHWRINVNYTFKDGLHNRSFFYKAIPSRNQFQADLNRRYRMFEREIFFHAEIFNQYKKFEDSKQCVPNCYYAKNDDLVFEDLNQRGFIMRELRNPMDKGHAVVVVKGVARFHAASFILEETKSKETNSVFRLEPMYKNDIKGGCLVKGYWYYKCMEEALKVAAKSEKYGKHTKHFYKLRSKWMVFADKAVELLLDPPKKYRNVILHLDLWNNNIMFKYDEFGKPIQCMFVDYQCCQISNPIADLMSFVCLCLEKETRDELSEELIGIYYKELEMILEESGINIDDILTEDDLRSSVEDYKLWGLVHALIICQFLFLEDSDKQMMSSDSETFERLGNGERSEELLRSFSKNEDYKKRFMDLIEEFAENYLLK